MQVYAGGSATSTTVAPGGFEQTRGNDTATLVQSGGYYQVYAGGEGAGVVIQNGAVAQVSGGTVLGVTVESGGNLQVYPGGVVSGASIIGRGMVTTGGTLADATLTPGAEVLIGSGAIVTDLTLMGRSVVDLGAIAYTAGGSATLASATDLLTISEGSFTTTLQLAGSYTGFYFDLSTYYGMTELPSDQPATEVTVEASRYPACYCSGTMIRTRDADAPIQDLRIGDMIITASGQHRAIKWVGRRSYAGRFLAANPGVQPICLAAGSLGDGLPRRDLWVSPEHAMFLDGVLVPARHLLNGSTIVRKHGLKRVDYFHIELDSHDVILAEGAKSESYLDDNNRGVFNNANQYAALHPDTLSSTRFYAPRVESGYVLEAIRRRLAIATESTTVIRETPEWRHSA